MFSDPSVDVMLPSSPNAPTTIVSPETATDSPKPSYASAFDAFRYAACVHIPSTLRVYTYAAPAIGAKWFGDPSVDVMLPSSYLAPTTIVSPETATDQPNSSFLSAFDAFRYAC